MGISIEISMYPLNENYKQPILNFIERLRSHEGLEVITNNLSTRIFGEFDVVMPVVQQEMKTTFDNRDTVVMVMKVLNKNLEI